MGFYPVPTRPFEELTMDIAENLNKAGGYQHLLIMQCILTDFVIIVLDLGDQLNALMIIVHQLGMGEALS